MPATTAPVNHERRGSGEPVVLVHGIGSRWQCFEPILDRLAAQHEVIAVDLPGFGGTPLVAGVRPGPRGYADWLEGWLREQGIERSHLVGSSMGGGVGLELGRRGFAASVTAFAPVGFWHTAGLRWTQGLLTTMRVAARTMGPALDRVVENPTGRALLLSSMFGQPRKLTAAMAQGDLHGLAAATAFEAARADFGRYWFDADSDLGALPDIPVTVAWGTRDVVLTHRTQSARARAALPSAQHVDLGRCGHLPFNDEPDTCARLVLATAAAAASHKENR
ncbi:alpha/beta fold hydrolase [Nocardioides stalactiti]|uniref:alpha/beta fold hydrolase n=1 Tax=Nocardioides stalactiti TaxID=2755356 RepID=UPI0015FEEDEA|nr:alpha/beta hydrolase [Nocardioides stalactiti]